MKRSGAVANLIRFKPAYNGRTLEAWITAEEERAENGKVWYKQSRWRKDTKRGATAPHNKKQQKVVRHQRLRPRGRIQRLQQHHGRVWYRQHRWRKDTKRGATAPQPRKGAMHNATKSAKQF